MQTYADEIERALKRAQMSMTPEEMYLWRLQQFKDAQNGVGIRPPMPLTGRRVRPIGVVRPRIGQ